MNGASHFAIGGLSAGSLAPILMWISTWPIQPLTEVQATSLSAVILAFIGGGGLSYIAYRNANGNGTGNGHAAPAPALDPAPAPAPEVQPAGAPAGAQGH